MKLPRRLALVALVGVPLALFFVTRRVSQERPVQLAVIPNCRSLTFSPDGKTLSAGTHRWNFLLSVETGKQVDGWAYNDPIAALKHKSPQRRYTRSGWLSPDEKWATSSDYHSLTIRDTATNHIKHLIRYPFGVDISEVGWSPQCKLIWVKANNGLSFFDTQSGQRLWQWPNLSDLVTKFQISDDDRLVVACDYSNCIARDAQSGREFWRTKNPNSSVFALSPDGKTLAEARQNGQIFLWPLPQTS